jgi:hypothetical protein
LGNEAAELEAELLAEMMADQSSAQVWFVMSMPRREVGCMGCENVFPLKNKNYINEQNTTCLWFL